MKTPPLHLLVVGTILVLLMYLLLTEWFSEPRREGLKNPVCWGDPVDGESGNFVSAQAYGNYMSKTLSAVTACYGGSFPPPGTEPTAAQMECIKKSSGSYTTLDEAKAACSADAACKAVLSQSRGPGASAYSKFNEDATIGPSGGARYPGSKIYVKKPCASTAPSPGRMTTVDNETRPKSPKNLMRWMDGKGNWVVYWEPPDVVNKYGFTIETSDGYKYQIPERTAAFHYYNLGQHTMGGVSFVLRMSVGGVVKSTLGFPVPTTSAAGDAKIRSWRAIRAPAPASPPPALLRPSVAPKITAKAATPASSTASPTGNSEILFWDNFSKRLLRVLDRWSGSSAKSYDQVPLNTMPYQHPSQPENPNPISNISR